MAKQKQVAYVPLNKTTEVNATAPTKIDTPQYPDQGITYAGYAKKLLSGNQYKLLPQTPFDSNIAYTFVGGVTEIDYNLLPNEAIYYITDIFFSSSFTNSVTFEWKELNSTGRLFLSMRIPTGVFNQHIHFSVPIKLTTRITHWSFSAAPPAGDIICLNTYGWIENE